MLDHHEKARILPSRTIKNYDYSWDVLQFSRVMLCWFPYWPMQLFQIGRERLCSSEDGILECVLCRHWPLQNTSGGNQITTWTEIANNCNSFMLLLCGSYAGFREHWFECRMSQDPRSNVLQLFRMETPRSTKKYNYSWDIHRFLQEKHDYSWAVLQFYRMETPQSYKKSLIIAEASFNTFRKSMIIGETSLNSIEWRPLRATRKVWL